MNRQTLLAWLLISTTIGTFFGPAVIRGRPLAFRDSAHFYYPLFKWCRAEWAAGRVPLWNPAESCGTPILADATSSVFYPGKLLFALPLDYDACFNGYIVLHVFIAALGAFALARAWRNSPAASTLAALAYSCGGSVVFQYCNVVFLVGAAWLPCCLLFAERSIRCGHWIDAVSLGVVLALMTLGGDPQAAYHGLLTTLLYAAVLCRKRLLEASSMSPSTYWLGRRILLIGTTGCVALALAAVQILPSIEATRLSERAAFNRPRNVFEATTVALQGNNIEQPLEETRAQSIFRGLFAEPESFTHHEAIYDFSIGPWRVAEMLWPNLGGQMFPTHRRWFSLLPGEGRIWTPSVYIGLLPALLALGSLIAPSVNARTRWLRWVTVLGVVGSLGFYGLGWLARELTGALQIAQPAADAFGNPVGGLYWLMVTLLPGYAYFRYPAKLLPLAALAVCLLGAKSFDRVFARHDSWITVTLSLLAVVSGSFALGFWLLGNQLFDGINAKDAVMGPFDASGARHDLIAAMTHTMLTSALLGVSTTLAAKLPTYTATFKWLAVLLTAVDLWLANAWTITSVPAEMMHRELAVSTQIRENGVINSPSTVPRVFRGNLVSWQPASFRKSSSNQRLTELAQWERATQLPRFHLDQQISLVESSGSIASADLDALLYVAKQHGPRQHDKSLTPQPTALRLLGTQYLVLPENHEVQFATKIDHPLTDWPDDTTLWRLNRSQPQAWVVHQIDSLPTLQQPRRKKLLEERAREVLFPEETARDFSRIAVVETDKPLAEWSESSPPSQNDPAQEKCEIVHQDSQRIVVTAELEKPGLLVLADAWYPGWQAEIKSDEGSRRATIYRTNRVLRGVWLPAGHQTVEFRYRSSSFYLGAAISGSSWLILSIAGLLNLAKRRQPIRP